MQLTDEALACIKRWEGLRLSDDRLRKMIAARLAPDRQRDAGRIGFTAEKPGSAA